MEVSLSKKVQGPLYEVLIAYVFLDKEDLERVFVITWAMFSPYLIEDNAYVKKNIYKELNSLLSTLQVRRKIISM